MNGLQQKLHTGNPLRALVLTAVMAALEFVLHRVLSFQTWSIQLHLGFIPIVILAILCGPVYAAVGAALGEMLGYFLLPSPGAFYFPGFTITAFITGLIFGFFLYQTKKKYSSVIIPVILVNILLTFGLDMYWLHVLYQWSFIVMLPDRFLKIALMIPAQLLLIFPLRELLRRHFGTWISLPRAKE